MPKSAGLPELIGLYSRLPQDARKSKRKVISCFIYRLRVGADVSSIIVPDVIVDVCLSTASAIACQFIEAPSTGIERPAHRLGSTVNCGLSRS